MAWIQSVYELPHDEYSTYMKDGVVVLISHRIRQQKYLVRLYIKLLTSFDGWLY